MLLPGKLAGPQSLSGQWPGPGLSLLFLFFSFPFHRVGKTAQKRHRGDFPGGPVVKTPPLNAGDMGLTPGWRVRILQEQLSLRLHLLNP